LTDLPPGVLLLVFISIAVGIVLVVSWVFYDKFILMAQLPPKEEEGEADSETLSESANLARLSSLAEDIPDPAGAAAVQEAVADYAASITEVQWPLLRVADNSAATSAVFDANITLFETIQQVQEADSSSSRVWNWIDSTPPNHSEADHRDRQDPADHRDRQDPADHRDRQDPADHRDRQARSWRMTTQCSPGKLTG
jgi:hypothetical protein